METVDGDVLSTIQYTPSSPGWLIAIAAIISMYME